MAVVAVVLIAVIQFASHREVTIVAVVAVFVVDGVVVLVKSD